MSGIWDSWVWRESWTAIGPTLTSLAEEVATVHGDDRDALENADVLLEALATAFSSAAVMFSSRAEK